MLKGDTQVIRKADTMADWRLILSATMLLTACTESGERFAGTTLAGAALGIPGGPIGVAVGAGAGAAAEALIPKEVFEGSPEQQ
jgi:hypothetical protein